MCWGNGLFSLEMSLKCGYKAKIDSKPSAFNSIKVTLSERGSEKRRPKGPSRGSKEDCRRRRRRRRAKRQD